ncbi:hypothetical protein [Micromonospora sp. NPDC051296]|uniref:hypothetical protein n=1 Tax=Micromonospora sp. NPDC051296 TaxID=3155046 RepID=UPI003427D5AD
MTTRNGSGSTTPGRAVAQVVLAAAGFLPVPPPAEPPDEPPEEPADEPPEEPPAEPDDVVLDEEVDVVELEDDDSDVPDLLAEVLDAVSEPEERESVR